MWKANAFGETVSRFLWMNYPEDEAAHGADGQFMLGSDLLITPVLEDGAREVEGYFPKGTWYSAFDYAKEPIRSEGEKITLPAELEEVNVQVRATITQDCLGDRLLQRHREDAPPTVLEAKGCTPPNPWKQ